MPYDSRPSGWRFFLTIVIGLVLMSVPLPHVLDPLRPDFILLFVIYWALSAPRVAGLTIAWICGFLIDVFKGSVLGEHALAFLIVAYITHLWQLRIRIFPIWQQAATIFMLLAGYQFIVFWIDGIVGDAVTTWARWLPVITGAVLWPFLVAIMDTWNRGRR